MPARVGRKFCVPSSSVTPCCPPTARSGVRSSRLDGKFCTPTKSPHCWRHIPMNRKHALMIFVGAWVSAGLLTWFLYASTKTPRIEKTIPIQAAAHDMPAGTLLRKADLKTVRMLERDVPKDAILDQAAALNRPLLFPVTANEPVTL